jgi:predicted nucleotide-binding protein
MAENLTRPAETLRELFGRVIAKGEKLRDEIAIQEAGSSPYAAIAALEAWDGHVRRLLDGAFTGPGPAADYSFVIHKDFLTNGGSFAENQRRIIAAYTLRLSALERISDLLELYEEPADAIKLGRSHPASKASTAVFIVHGHANGPKYEVARYLETATSAQPVILHEQAKRGQVIIETLESFAATAAFAIVLLTADDQGCAVGANDVQGRARQNVVFELGFFIGALGRSRVAVLYEDGVELPSDMNGILYTILDAQGAWRIGLGRELRAAGFAVDLNRAT